MPGVVKKIQCEEKDFVVEGVIIVTLEAMKMQNPLFAPIVSGYSRTEGEEENIVQVEQWLW